MPWDENADRFSTNGKNLLVEKPGPGGLGPSITLHNSGGGVNASATIDFDTAPDIATPPVSRIQTVDVGIATSDIVSLTKQPAPGGDLVAKDSWSSTTHALLMGSRVNWLAKVDSASPITLDSRLVPKTPLAA
jgi:hypothetical protein